MLEYLSIIITAIFINNIVLAQFLGICPFLGVSKRISSAVGMGMAVTFVITIATTVTWLLQYFVLTPLGLEFLQTIAFILVIAFLVQLLEIVMKKTVPAMYQALGVFLPLITTNCAVLGVAVINMNEKYDLLTAVVNAFGTAVGYMLAIVMMAGIREKIELNADMPRCMRGLPIALITAGLMSIAFMGFSGLVK